MEEEMEVLGALDEDEGDEGEKEELQDIEEEDEADEGGTRGRTYAFRLPASPTQPEEDATVPAILRPRMLPFRYTRMVKESTTMTTKLMITPLPSRTSYIYLSFNSRSQLLREHHVTIFRTATQRCVGQGWVVFSSSVS